MKKILPIIFVLALLGGCADSEPNFPYVLDTTPYELPKPSNFPQPDIPSTNLLTKAKVKLGRSLFYDPIISLDSSLTCGKCHDPKFSFSDPRKLSINLNGPTQRNSMPLINLAYTNKFFWDGRKMTLEDAVQDALEGEQNYNFDVVAKRVNQIESYKKMFGEAFGTAPKPEHVRMAIASFVRTIVSYQSPFDKGKQQGDYALYLGASAKRGATIFSTEKGDCFHCHGDIQANNLFTNNDFHNNGLDSVLNGDVNLFKDYGHGKITSIKGDYGKFKTPTVRNIIYTAPFFHDGRAADIDAAFKHYNEQVVNSPTIDANMKKAKTGGINLTSQEMLDLKNFVLSLTDTTIISNPEFQSPFP
jgi:cytochrome c peroxidase